MAKKSSKSAAKAAKKAKATHKGEQKHAKRSKAANDDDDDNDLEAVLEKPAERLLLPSLPRRHPPPRCAHAAHAYLHPSLFRLPHTGGYCKEYINGKRPVGVTLDDTWFLSLSLPTSTSATTATTTRAKAKTPTAGGGKVNARPAGLAAKWARRKTPGYTPTPARAGCTMALWSAHAGGAGGCGRGVLFGGVTDEERGEEGLESHFWNELKPKKGKGKAGRGRGRGGKKGKRQVLGGSDSELDAGGDGDAEDAEEAEEGGVGLDDSDPSRTIPIPRYNAMLAVLRNTLYIYGGTLERGSREYTLDDFYAIQLEKMERYVCLRECGVVIPEGEVSSSEDDDDSDDDDDDDDDDYDDGDIGDEENGEEDGEEGCNEVDGQNENPADEDTIERGGINEDTPDQTPEAKALWDGDSTGTPLPGETLAMFYARTLSYKPMLEEVEKILAEAGLDEEEMRRGGKAGLSAASGGAGGGPKGVGQGRSRR
ncbi:hypothetical protein C0992_007305 [Termitomyces sp. T32_za158]|nr:hypothetical protein C0992_007305 [Termitomyces sp. T32_za158]